MPLSSETREKGSAAKTAYLSHVGNSSENSAQFDNLVAFIDGNTPISQVSPEN